MTEQIIITCVSDIPDFAADVYDYLNSELERQKVLEEGKHFQISKESVRVNLEENQIYVDRSTLVQNGLIKLILQSFLKSNPTKFKDYDVFEIADTFTIGKVLDLSKSDAIMHTCEICGFFTPYSEEIYTHRMTHFGL